MKETDYTDWSKFKNIPLHYEEFKRKDEIGKQLMEKYKVQRQKEKYLKLVIRLVASFLIISLGITATYQFSDQTLVTHSNNSLFELPDGSSVVLRPYSRLSYNRIQWFFNRKIQLNGSGKFNIEPGRSCTVYTPDITVAVLGTIFEINQTGKITEVTCEQGRVRVFNNLVSKNLLGNQTIRVNATGYDFISGEDNSAKPVQIRELVYDSETLDKITTELNTHYQCQIHLDSACRSDLFSGKIPEENLDQALIIISECCGLKYRKEDGYIYLFK